MVDENIEKQHYLLKAQMLNKLSLYIKQQKMAISLTITQKLIEATKNAHVNFSGNFGSVRCLRKTTNNDIKH